MSLKWQKKTLSVEGELNDIKNNIKNAKQVENSIETNTNYESNSDNIPDSHNKSTASQQHESESNNTKESEKTEGTEQKEDKKINDEKSSQKLLACNMCEYKCKRETTLNKHKNKKHEERKCKVCKRISPTVIDMLQHVADKHNNKNMQIQGNEEKYDIYEHQTKLFYKLMLLRPIQKAVRRS